MAGWSRQAHKSGRSNGTVLLSPQFARHLRAMTAAAVCAGLLAACASDPDSDATPDDAAASPIAADSAGVEDASAGDASGSEDSGDAGDSDSNGGAASGTAQWEGDSYEYDSVMCQDQSQFGQFTMVANGPDAPTLSVQIEFDPLEDPDYSQPTRVELFFGEGGGTIGEGEGYTSPYGPVEGAASSNEGASGSVQLEPDEITTAPDINPDGGQLDFEISCG